METDYVIRIFCPSLEASVRRIGSLSYFNERFPSVYLFDGIVFVLFLLLAELSGVELRTVFAQVVVQ